MKEVLSLFTFGIGASCLVVFVIVFKPATRKLRLRTLAACTSLRNARSCGRTAIVSAVRQGRSLPKQEAADRSAAPAWL
jgi:hypothetical protein